ncbi:hypothetical protein [Sphingomonas sp. ACRSK]|uniref:hypothetical protein n=1 Tax=Sphingomonas sp. ACRSK TaxID=2918213 RepID=UPI001EF4FAE2|nr:hypothetical protein [Sphingomonas sp. ACRSK]MCG7348835.1 hypothetical protein [Sphingomonas sp. ACRSK]
MTTINPRRPLDDDDPDGSQESDKDFVANNLDACVAWLKAQTGEDGERGRDMVRVRVLEDAADIAERRPLTTFEISGIREAARYLRTRHKA